jgi:ATP synthase protein I
MAEDSAFKHLLKASTLGIHLVVATFVGLAIGYFLDKALGTKPWLTFIFLFLGIFTGFRDMFRIVKRDVLSPEEEQSYPEGQEPRGDWDDDEESGDSKNGW